MIEIGEIQYLDTAEAAEHLDVSAHSVRRWCDYGLLDGVVDRGPDKKPRYFIPVPSLDDFVPPSLDGGAGWPAGKKRKNL